MQHALATAVVAFWEPTNFETERCEQRSKLGSLVETGGVVLLVEKTHKLYCGILRQQIFRPCLLTNQDFHEL